MEQIRINKYLSEVGYCSRRAADKLLEEGRITINGKITEYASLKFRGRDFVYMGGIVFFSIVYIFFIQKI